MGKRRAQTVLVHAHASASLLARDAATNLGGYTIQEAEGGWKGDDGKEYQEYTLVIYLSDTDLNTVHKVSRELIDEFYQSSVLISTERVKTEFYAGGVASLRLFGGRARPCKKTSVVLSRARQAGRRCAATRLAFCQSGVIDLNGTLGETLEGPAVESAALARGAPSPLLG